MPTLGTQERLVRLSGGRQVYAIDTVVTDEGDLPDPGVFLYRILDPADQTLDRLLRICTVADMVNYDFDRVVAVANGAEYWRGSYLTREHTDVRVAQTDSSAIKDLVDRLVNQWVLYEDDFSTALLPGGVEEIEWPLPDEALKTQLESDYEAAIAARDETQASLTAKQAECSEIEDRVTELEADVATLQSTVATVTDIETSMGASILVYETFLATGGTFATDVQAGLNAYALEPQSGFSPGSYDFFGDPDPNTIGEPGEGTVVIGIRTFRSDLTDAQAALSDLETQQTRIGQQLGVLQGQLASREGELNTERNNLQTCQTAAINLQYELNTHQAQAQAAADALLAVCPDADVSDL